IKLDEAIRKAKQLIRRRKFIELVKTVPPVEALEYLRTKVHETFDDHNPQESEQYRKLMWELTSGSLLSRPSLPPKEVHEGFAIRPGPELAASKPSQNSTASAGSHHATVSPDPHYTPVMTGPIAQAAGSSFPPPPSPTKDQDPMSGSGFEGSALARGLAILADPEDRRSYTPPPAPIMQPQPIPIRAATLPVQLPPQADGSMTARPVIPPPTRVPTPPSPQPEGPPPVEEALLSEEQFQGRLELFKDLMQFVDPKAKEPQTDLLDFVSRDHHTEMETRWY
ncbi:hypothetical protein FRB90_008596, partial [Tulasnella sp. 427]